MTDEELTAILTQRGYRMVEDNRPVYRLDLVVEPVREGPKVATKLGQKWQTCNLTADGLHWMLSHYCELQGQYYTDEQRRDNKRGAQLT